MGWCKISSTPPKPQARSLRTRPHRCVEDEQAAAAAIQDSGTAGDRKDRQAFWFSVLGFRVSRVLGRTGGNFRTATAAKKSHHQSCDPQVLRRIRRQQRKRWPLSRIPASV